MNKNISFLKRILFFGLADSVAISLSLYLAFLIRFDFDFRTYYIHQYFWKSLPYFLAVRTGFFFSFGLYRVVWSYVGLRDILNIVTAVIFSSFTIAIIIYYLKIKSLIGFPRSLLIIETMLSFLLVSGVRVSKRLFMEKLKKGKPQGTNNTLILGAGNTGEMILRDIFRDSRSSYKPIGILDDDKNKKGTLLHGVNIWGNLYDLRKYINKYQVTAVIIAIPSLNHGKLRKVYLIAKGENIKEIKIVPRIYDFSHPKINLKSLEDISIEDLIGRDPVEIDFEAIGIFLKGKRIMVSGGGGSIGAEIILQICSFHSSLIIVMDFDETALHHLEIKVKKKYPDLAERMVCLVGDVRDPDRVKNVFETYKPEIVYHAAAYKHVPMMEANSGEAIKVNIIGTYNLARIAKENKVKKFTLISTDKAVNPTSVMGATKRMAEYICKAFNNQEPGARGQGAEDRGQGTEFLSVRFGNVLGSRGSVLPLFMDQLKEGGPLTVTHKDIERYFMTIPEAVSLVLQASVVGKGGDILVLDMGEPVKIVKLAEDLIRLHGFKPYEDIDIVFSGLRPGEKLFEELLTAEEGSFVTRHKKIFKAKISEDYSLNQIEKIVEEFKESVYLKNSGEKEIKDILKKYIRWYQGAINSEH